ncbi:MAG: anthranilate synthase component I family protein [Alicyclobacillus sp.]|nr:anthranilate synthase component I family protein [Alicyclobacillus sp.]
MTAAYVRTAAGDPFYLYLHLTAALGEGQVFLLDAAQDDAHPAYQMSLLAAFPVLEVAVKDHRVLVFTEPALQAYLTRQLQAAGFTLTPAADGEGFARSVLAVTPWTTHAADPMAFLEAVRAALRPLQAGPVPPFAAGFLGYIGYDAVHYLEKLPRTTVDDRGLPDVRLQWHACTLHWSHGQVLGYSALGMLQHVLPPERLQAWEAAISKVWTLTDQYMAHPQSPQWLAEPEVADAVTAVDDVPQPVFEAAVERAKEYIRAGDIFQVVLSKRVRVERRVPYALAYDRLRRLNPSPYMFVATYPDLRLFGASPEVQFRAVDGVAQMKPIAGTSKGRGRTPAEDEALRQALLQDEKERAEHIMLVDLCRNDLGRVCTTGSVRVDKLLTVEPYSHLFHLVSEVSGKLRPDVSVFHALLATFPAGTLTGAPKIRAMEIIDELEHYARGPYGGLIGMVDFAANANTAIIIRTVIEWNGQYYVQAGAGLVADSQPRQEWLETGHKAGALMEVLGVRSATVRS